VTRHVAATDPNGWSDMQSCREYRSVIPSRRSQDWLQNSRFNQSRVLATKSNLSGIR